MRASEFQQLNERKLPQARRPRPLAAPAAPVAAPVQQAPVAAPVQQAPVAAPSSGYLDKIKQKMYSTGQGIANRFSTQGKISARTDKIFVDKFIKDLKSAEQTSTGLRGRPLDLPEYITKYLARNRWKAGNQQAALNQAVATAYKPQIAKIMAAIGKANNRADGATTPAVAPATTPATTPAVTPATTPAVAPATTTTAAPAGPSVNPDGSITIAGAKGQSPSKIQPGDPMYKSLLAAINKQAASTQPTL